MRGNRSSRANRRMLSSAEQNTENTEAPLSPPYLSRDSSLLLSSGLKGTREIGPSCHIHIAHFRQWSGDTTRNAFHIIISCTSDDNNIFSTKKIIIIQRLIHTNIIRFEIWLSIILSVILIWKILHKKRAI